ncbi:hypothetical protein GCM10027580_05360 [Corynebacterium faecale]
MLATTALLVTACSQNLPDSPDMGGATPVASPAAESPVGSVVDYSAAITDLEVADGDILGVRSEENLAIGTVADFEAGDEVNLGVDKQCGDLTATGDRFVLACADGVYLIDATDPDLDTVQETDKPTTVAALTSAGLLIAGNDVDDDVTVYRDGEEPVEISVQNPGTEMIAVPVDDRHDAVVRIWDETTTIQDVDYPNERAGATLRVGLGVAQMAGGEDGLMVVSDNIGNQLAIYNADDLIRLHMTAPVDDAPWGVAWDSVNSLAWITTLSNNQLTGFRISEGVPEEQHRLGTVADAQNVVALEDGSLVVASASGDGLQIIAPGDFPA